MTKAAPSRMKKEPSVVMKDGIPVRVVMRPCRSPNTSGRSMAARKAAKVFHESFVMSSPMTIGVMANIEPTDRSNSPDIIRNATPTPVIPSGAATVNIPAISAEVRKLLVIASKITLSTTIAAIAPNGRAWSSRLSTPAYRAWRFRMCSSLAIDMILAGSSSLARHSLLPGAVGTGEERRALMGHRGTLLGSVPAFADELPEDRDVAGCHQEGASVHADGLEPELELEGQVLHRVIALQERLLVKSEFLVPVGAHQAVGLRIDVEGRDRDLHAVLIDVSSGRAGPGVAQAHDTYDALVRLQVGADRGLHASLGVVAVHYKQGSLVACLLQHALDSVVPERQHEGLSERVDDEHGAVAGKFAEERPAQDRARQMLVLPDIRQVRDRGVSSGTASLSLEAVVVVEDDLDAGRQRPLDRSLHRLVRVVDGDPVRMRGDRRVDQRDHARITGGSGRLVVHGDAQDLAGLPRALALSCPERVVLLVPDHVDHASGGTGRGRRGRRTGRGLAG